MFQPPIFREERAGVMHALMREHPFATLVSNAGGSLAADHIPLVLHDDVGTRGTLRGHLAAGNPLCRKTTEPFDALAIFQGPQAYITPSWYASKQEHGKVVPTWNYVAVHVRGTMSFKRDANWLLTHLRELTAQHEGQRPTPWQVSDAPDDFVNRQLKGLVGLEIQIEELTGTWKVSQNKTHADSEGVCSGLVADGSEHGVALSRLVADRARR